MPMVYYCYGRTVRRLATAILRAMRVMLCTARDALRYVHRAVRERRRRI